MSYALNPSGGDDAAPLQAAVNSRALTVLPPGDFHLSAPVSVPAGRSLVGSGVGVTRLLRSGADSSSLILHDNSTVQGLSLVGDVPYQDEFDAWYPGATVGRSVDVQGSFCRIRDLGIDGCGTGIAMTGPTVALYMHGIDFRNFYVAGLSLGTATGWANDVYLDQFIMDTNPEACPNADGILIQGLIEAVTVSNGDIIHGARNLAVINPRSYVRGQCSAVNKFVNVYFDSSSVQAILLMDCLLQKFSNCWIAGAGAKINRVNDVSFDNCEFTASSTHGAQLADVGAKRVRFNGCTFQRNNGHGLYVAPGVSDFAVEGGTFSNGGTEMNLGSTQQWGVYVATGGSDRYVIRPSLTSGNGTGRVSDGGSGTNKIVEQGV